jgi:hypothetical protein
MEVVNCGTGNKIPYAVQDSIISFNGGELMLDLARYQRDFARTLDICRDKFGGLVMGLGENYAAQIEIPARKYEYVEAEDICVPAQAVAVENAEQPAEIAMLKQALALDMDRVKLTLWDI